ncbi:tRNA 2-thiouridine(34) synthase MnmA [Solirubrobacter sp. CPCC 204708]|uniref:tRNA-specific 2-thiouridylase MnmA n=1 Tax=Solirubrobacter deserti TaxID=2282478 RepID=A0ABT4RHZ1_9ACTN|nr:tRNA 2-thiouridine(34) synthase MnmA [Solirubrobacter deserti]MBE2316578.1 tRNA 2-thiouridine(34) synthase MnmA [Solirubrobacter deserti]MDA0138110.1 tRNA 2-thiouridine(34) synthase MnmA [Solirubrobacter deserti]
MDRERFEEHLAAPQGCGVVLPGAHDGAAGGALCGDLIRLSVVVEGDRVVAAAFDADGCGALTAAGSAAVTLVEGEHLFDAARVGTTAIAAELGGLSPGKLHAADLAADALHRALGAAAREAAVPVDSERVLVAMSGGVDSAVAAHLLRENAVAVTLELWRDEENDAAASCCSADAVRLARMVAHQMGLPHFTLDLRPEFRAGVVDPFLAGYAAGETPNPCVSCNGHVRLDEMLTLADRLGAPFLATGHYARVTEDGLLRAAADPAKDQSYMLAALSPASIARMRFPLAELTKPQVREIAAGARLPVASRADSQDLCFLAGTGKARFLARHGGLEDKPGEIVTLAGDVVGAHRGAHHFTVGQRKGLGVGAAPEPLYVIRTEGTRVVVGSRDELATRRVRVRGARLHRPSDEVDAVRLRYHSRAVPCRVVGEGRSFELELDEPFHGAAPGQTACLLRGDVVVGVGTITA